MKHYLDLVSKYHHANPRRTRLTVLSVALSVALVTAVFSMVDVFLRTEKLQVIYETGNYHLVVEDPTDAEKAALASRVDVKNAGEWTSFERGSVQGVDCVLAAVDENYAANMRMDVQAGRFPTAENEIMLEQWALERFEPALKLGDTATVRFANDEEHTYVISGVFTDVANLKASATPAVVLSTAAARASSAKRLRLFLMEFKDGVNVMAAQQSIETTLNISGERVHRNEKLLAVMGQSQHQSALSIYATGAVMFFIVLIAGVMMIYNTFNISVLDRVRQFGLLRCVGASRAQIQRIVRREGLAIAWRAIPLGALAGVVITFACSALVKYFAGDLFAEAPLFVVSPMGIAAGALVGLLTVWIAALAPARKAASVSPVVAVTGGADTRVSTRKKSSLLTRLFHVDVALGVNNAFARKKTLVLMSCSIAISVVLFLGFNVYIDFMYSMMKTTKPYTPDVSILAAEGGALPAELYQQVAQLDGVRRVYGRMFGYVQATFDARRLTKEYTDLVGPVTVLEDGTFVPPEPSWLISYDANQFNWARRDLVDGVLDEAALNAGNGVVAVMSNLRKSVTNQPVDWRVGDVVRIDTPAGPREVTVMGILRTAPFSDSNLNLTTLITTEALFTELTGQTPLKVIDVQLKTGAQTQTIERIQALMNGEMTFHDSRQKNAEVNQIFFTMAVFVYGFVIVIAVISVLNIINTMNTSVAAKTRYLGVMRAVGMDGRQIDRMVLVEAATYSVLGCVLGGVVGVALQKFIAERMLSFAHIRWEMPWLQLALIAALTLGVTALSVIQPVRRIKERGISEVIVSL